MNIKHYLAGSHYSKIKNGQSGAEVYEINGDLILKQVERRKLNDSLFDTYISEALFYQAKKDDRKKYLPRILQLEISDDEILLLMKKYRIPSRSDMDETMIRKITGALACVHTDSIPEFLHCVRTHSAFLSVQQIEESRAGWECVLKEHPGAFDETTLKHVADKINKIIEWHESEEKVLIHGDFHWDNLLEDDQGDVLICDWQNVGLGAASGDLGFFMSRLGSDDVVLDQMLFLKCYADAVRDISGASVDTQLIARHIAAANVITSFVFWHRYLHGEETERVRGIFKKMADDFQLVIKDLI